MKLICGGLLTQRVHDIYTKSHATLFQRCVPAEEVLSLSKYLMFYVRFFLPCLTRYPKWCWTRSNKWFRLDTVFQMTPGIVLQTTLDAIPLTTLENTPLSTLYCGFIPGFSNGVGRGSSNDIGRVSSSNLSDVGCGFSVDDRRGSLSNNDGCSSSIDIGGGSSNDARLFFRLHSSFVWDDIYALLQPFIAIMQHSKLCKHYYYYYYYYYYWHKLL